MFICWMDRIVWFILMMVFSNLLVEITGVQQKKVINVTTEKKDIIDLNEISTPKDVEIINKKIIMENSNKKTSNNPVDTKINSKIEIDDKGKIISRDQQQTILDSIFNIPISTLKAVNNLVQVIVGSIPIPEIRPIGQQQQQQQTISKQKRKQFNKYTKDLNLTMFSI